MPQAIGLIATGIGAVGQYQQGQDAKNLARNNSILLGNQADEAQRVGVINQNNYRRQLNQFIGRQRATIAANNVQNAGSPLALQEDAAAQGEADIANIRNQAALDAWGFKTQASDVLARGKSAETAANVGAFSSLLSAGAQGYSAYKGTAAGSRTADQKYARKYATQRKGYGKSGPILTGDSPTGYAYGSLA